MPRKPARRYVADYRRELFSDTFLKRTEAPVFRCGNVTLTLHQLASDLECPFPMSAVRLQRVLEEHSIKNLNRLFALGLHGLAALVGVGDSLCDVATVILAHQGFDLVAFCAWKENEIPVRFQTLKNRQKAQKARRTLPADKPYLPSDFDEHGKPRQTAH